MRAKARLLLAENNTHGESIYARSRFAYLEADRQPESAEARSDAAPLAVFVAVVEFGFVLLLSGGVPLPPQPPSALYPAPSPAPMDPPMVAPRLPPRVPPIELPRL